MDRMRRAMTPQEFQVLVSLAGQDRHGLGIMREVDSRTGGSVWLGPGTLYTALKRMKDGGLIQESEDRPAPSLDDPRRRYYRLTDRGLGVVEGEVRRMDEAVRQARKLGIASTGSVVEGVG